MSQTTYNQVPPCGAAGGLYDLSNHDIVTRMNGETSNAMKFGFGVVQGSAPGSNIKVPVAGTTAAKFEGIVVNGGYNAEMDRDGAVIIPPMASLSILQQGKIWGRIKSGIAPKYGDSLYLIIDGDDAGCFTNAADVPAEGKSSITIAIKGRFIGPKGTGNVAPIELFGQAQA